MSWAENLLDASFRGVPFDVVEESVQAERSLAQHGTPYQDGDAVEDLGQGARVYMMRAVLFGTNYEFELRTLLDALDTIGPGELVHPVYGSVAVVSKGYTVHHGADRPDYAQVELNFVGHKPDEPFFTRDLIYTIEQKMLVEDEYTWQDGIFDFLAAIDSLVAEIQEWIGGGWTGLLEKALGLPGIGLRLQQLRSQILGVVSGVVDLFKSNPLSAFDPLTDLLRTPTEIRSVIQGSTPTDSRSLLSRSGVPFAMPGAESLTADAARAGSAFLLAARQGVEPDSAVLPAEMPSDPVEATALGLVVLTITELAVSHVQAVAAVIDDEATAQTLSPDDLERLVNLARSLAESAVLLHRRLYDVESALPVINALRSVAGLVQARARSVILLSPPLVERTVSSATSLRRLAHHWYGDHARAEELMRLNPGLKAPHNIEAGEVLRAYAK
ncbi:Mu-like prophage DNA circulation protein [Pseudomonas asplenii]|uniref:Mu-like prophage DNA circulation protein n=1 Tax=Pseudomonas asplenii TaxID=53407 RepID=A0A0M9GI10_9PSED|nr:Mu-like prophage DNA circulation protein [Pseudomonas fuscovaginae]